MAEQSCRSHATRTPEFCQEEFGHILSKLERIDVALRGNGTPGIQTRLDRLERNAAVRAQLVWAVVVPTVALVITNVWYLFVGVSRVSGS